MSGVGPTETGGRQLGLSEIGLGEDEEQLRRLIERFSREVVAPVIGGYYERAEFPYDIVRQLGDLGVFGIPFPEAYGGGGGDERLLAVALEELARVDTSVAITVEAAVNLGAMGLYRFGSDEQRAEWLPELASGRMLAAFALTEPTGGSDAGGLRTTAVRRGGEWVINGAKSFITNSGTDITGLVVVAAVTGTTAEGRPEVSTILVPSNSPGLTVAPGYSKVGWCASDTHELGFVDCAVPEANLLGTEGRGYAQFLELLDAGRIAIAAICAGLAQGCLDECLAYAADRVAFGRPIAEFQAIQFKLADMACRAHTARLAYRQAAETERLGRPIKRDAAIAKLVASQAAMDNARDATQVFGGYGFMNESPVGRFYRDAKALEIGEGTSEVLRLVIARELGVAGRRP